MLLRTGTSTYLRRITSLLDAIDLYKNPILDTIRFDRKVLMPNHYPKVQKYHERVLAVAKEHDKSEGAIANKVSKMAITFEDLTKH